MKKYKVNCKFEIEIEAENEEEVMNKIAEGMELENTTPSIVFFENLNIKEVKEFNNEI